MIEIFFGKKRKGASQLSKRIQSEFLQQQVQEFFFMSLGFFILFLCLAIASYSPFDNSPFYFNTLNDHYQNWGGALGAYTAAYFFFMCGNAAYLITGCLLAAWIYRFVHQKSANYPFRFVLGAILFNLFFLLLLRLMHTHVSQVIPAGIVGHGWFNALTRWLGPVGVGMSTVVGCAVALSLLFEMSVYKIMRSMVVVLRVTWHALLFVGRVLFDCVRWSILQMYTNARFYARSRAILNAADKEALEVKYAESCDEQIVDHDVMVAHEENIVGTSINHPVGEAHDDEKYAESSEAITREEKERFYQFGSHKLLLPRMIWMQRANPWRRAAFKKMVTIKSAFKLPDVELLVEESHHAIDRSQLEDECRKRGVQLEEKLRHFGIRGSVVAIKPGPVITLYEYQPDIDVKISSIIAREDDLAMVLRALSIRIVAPIPGTSVVGFEIANERRDDVYFSEIVQTTIWKQTSAHLPLLLGVDTAGNPVVQDLASMPHLLIAGSTGSGKSVCVHSLLVSLLSRKTPDELRMILIDPKRLEFASYADIPHLLFPIVTESQRAVTVLKWVVHEMERRYEAMSHHGVRNIGEYSKMSGERGIENLPYIVVVIDELADLMIVAGKEIELQLVRIAQMARAAGIHVVIATQRPSVDVVTGLIKVNFPSRLACRVSSKIDSRTIIDVGGAEKLLGRGDMLYVNASSAFVRRIHGAYVSESQVERLVKYLRSLGKPNYIDLEAAQATHSASSFSQDSDELYPQVLELIKTVDDVSISSLQRRLRIGFNRAARLIELLEADGLLAPAQAGRPRKILR